MKLNRLTFNSLPLLLMVMSLFTSNLIMANETLTPTKLLFVGSAHSNKAKVTLLKEITNNNSKNNWQIAYQSARSLKDLSQAQALFNQQDIIVFDAVSVNEAKKTFAKYLPLLNKNNSQTVNHKTKFISLNWLNNSQSHHGFSTSQLKTFTDYWQNAGRQNLSNLLSFLSISVIKQKSEFKVKAPIIFPLQGIYHPNQPNLISNSLTAYQTWSTPKKNQPKIAILLQRALIESEQTKLIDETIKQLEDKGIYVVPFFFELSRTSGDYQHLLYLGNEHDHDDKLASGLNQTSEVDLIINFRNIHWASKRKIEFEKFGIPVMQAMTYYSGDQQTWEEDKQGVSAGMMSFTLVLPESAGVVDPMVVAAMDMKSQTTQIIDYQLEHLINKAVNLVNLKYKANKEKKLSIFIWGDQDVGASFMNIPASLTAISQHLASKGYQTGLRDQSYLTDNVKRILNPFYRDFELNKLLDEDLAELMPMKDYLTWFNKLPAKVTAPINQYWGDPKDHFMAVERNGEHYFILPRMRDGNILIMRQPPRTDKKNDEDAVYHQGIVPMNHFYLAAYFYAREYWQSDAIVHLGTHGSQEYLGGKERGLSIYDQGNLAVWDTPVVYPFIVDDVGEAMQTKRRGRATVISHMTPPFAAAGLHGDMSHLHELMHQYKSLDQGGVKQKTAKQIVELCFSTNICKDIAWQQTEIDENYDGFFDDLHVHMESLATANQPLGLHTFGELAEQELLISTLIQMLGNDFTKLASKFEHEYYASSEENVDSDDADHSHSYHTSGNENGANVDIIDTEQLEGAINQLAGFKFVKNYIVMSDKNPSKEASSELPIALDDLDKELKTLVTRGKVLYRAMTGIHELEAMTDFLSNKYIPVKTGGDPIRHPESLATGYNLYGFDPSKVPTKAAFEQGKELVDQMIHNYQKKHYKFPDKMAFSLWSIETMRHYGVLESQVLYAMGVTPKWSKGGRVIGTEVIPYSELKRPRIDVVLSATGLYRDAFPSVMQMLAKAVKQVAELKNDNTSMWKNHVALNSQRIQAELIKQGIDTDEAQYLSTIRMFSNASGDYGSGVDGPAWASDTWETDKKISDNYLGKMGFFFGSDSSRWGEKAKNAQGQDIQLYAKQLSGTDIALLSRSSNLFGMLSSDDPFEYFGGISLAVRNIDGKSPDMVISNLRNATDPKAEDAALFMAKELRTRMFHPRWIKEMQKEGYAGAVSLASKMDNFFGWQVVDPNLVRNDQWDEYFDIYVNDKLNIKLDEWFEKTNPASLARMMERMLEAERKDYWQADSKRLQQLVEQYIQMINQYDLIVLNDALRENVNQLAAGFGLTAVLEQPTMKDMAKQAVEQKMQNKQQIQVQQSSNKNESEQVEGQKLEQQSQPEKTAPDNFIWQALSIMLLIMLFGGVRQHLRSKNS